MKVEIDGIALSEPVLVQEKPDESFAEQYAGYVQFQRRSNPDYKPMPLTDYANIQRQVLLPLQSFSLIWRDRHPSYSMPEWEPVYQEADFELRKRIPPRTV